MWVWVWLSLAPTIKEHKGSVNTLCAHRRSPLEHCHVEPGLSYFTFLGLFPPQMVHLLPVPNME